MLSSNGDPIPYAFCIKYLCTQSYLVVYKRWLLIWQSFPGGTSGKERACQSPRPKRHGLIPRLGRAW